MVDVIGVDVGFGFTKAYNGKGSVIFKSVLGESSEIQFHSNLKDDNDPSKNLHVTIDDKTFFIGEFAETQSSVRLFTLDQNKLLADYAKVLALTAIGLCNDDELQTVNVVSGLPVGFLKRDHQRLIELLRGKHRVVFHTKDGTRVTKKINIPRVKMMPQPLGSVFNLLMDDHGKIINQDLVSKKIGVVDIGFRTTDYSVFDKLQYIERGSGTMDTGLSKSLNIIAGKLKKESGINIELYRLHDVPKKGALFIKGKEYNITNLKQKVYEHAASSIVADMNRLWVDDWDIEAILITGGGSRELLEFLNQSIDGNVIPIDSTLDSRTNNVKGYYKFAKHEWGQMISQSQQVREVPKEEPELVEEPPKPESIENKPKSMGWLRK
ncbi:MAG: ParM/StbA family protein [Desulfobacterales bacterium]|nr:ParM/StbA family protein [Desulfobacterales bacterium]MCP4159995.1 ParM/StbA family protein [Deltaproteobacteria bacterium]